MARTFTQLDLPQPCPAQWAAMTPTPHGRHCAACQKTVVDFTLKTDAEILAYLAQAVSTPCGRFQASQLARPLLPPPAPSRWRTWLGALLAAGSLSTLLAPKAAAQYHYAGSAGPVPVAATPGQGPEAAPSPTTPVLPAPAAPLPGSPATIRGVVVDARNHEPLPGVTVLIKGTTQGISTDMAGAFELPVAVGAEPVQLRFSFIGYTSVEQTVAASTGAPLAVVLQEDVAGLLGIVVVGGAPRKPWPWHPRRLYHWSKARLAQAFR
ncbi:MAG: hypothetical protein EOO59_07385 [Hymenobacter sp.]|nr:MAG: hypothetical protein EOO59_07385 [Hymenobacter sp.]